MAEQVREKMPIMGSGLMDHIPMAMIAPHEKQAQTNHYQTLERLAQRGGLSIKEALAVLRDLPWREVENMPDEQAFFQLMNLVREWRTAAMLRAREANHG